MQLLSPDRPPPHTKEGQGPDHEQQLPLSQKEEGARGSVEKHSIYCYFYYRTSLSCVTSDNAA